MTNTVAMKTDKSTPTRSARKRTDSPKELRVVSKAHINEELQYLSVLNTADVQAAIRDSVGAQARRDSISRKLCAGSTAVTVNDLAHWEEALCNANKNLATLARRMPILERNPVVASVVAHS